MHDLDEPFTWHTQDGESMSVRQMRTSHLFYSVRMIYNHTVPATLQIPGCKRYSGPDQWPVEYRRNAIAAMLAELSTRQDVAAWMSEQLVQMRDGCRVLSQRQIEHPPTHAVQPCTR